MTYRYWLAHEELQLQQLRRQRVPVAEIAKQMNRPLASIRCKITALKLRRYRVMRNRGQLETEVRRFIQRGITSTLELADRLGLSEKSIREVKRRIRLKGQNEPTGTSTDSQFVTVSVADGLG